MDNKNSDIEINNKNKPIFDYAIRKLDICGICNEKYNVGDKIPRI